MRIPKCLSARVKRPAFAAVAVAASLAGFTQLATAGAASASTPPTYGQPQSYLSATDPLALASFGTHSLAWTSDADDGSVWINTGPDNAPSELTIPDLGDGNVPEGLAADQNGNLWTTVPVPNGTGSELIEITDPAGSASLASVDLGYWAQDVTVDANGNVYVLDRSDDEVYEYASLDATPTVIFGPAFEQPQAIAVNPSGQLVVYDRGNAVFDAYSDGQWQYFADGTGDVVNQMTFDPSGNLYIAAGNYPGIYMLAAGSLYPTFLAQAENPTGVAWNHAVYFSEYGSGIDVELAPQTVTFPAAPTGVQVGGPVNLSTPNYAATDTSSDPVTYTSQTPDVCTVGDDGTTVTPTAVGTCTIEADVAADSTYGGASTTESFDISLATQTVSFASAPTGVHIGDTLDLSTTATASSGDTVTYSSTTSAVCTISGTTLTLTAVGECTIEADVAADATYAAASNTESFDVALEPQTLTVTQPGDLIVNQAEQLAASASSGLPAVLADASTGVCTLAGTTVTGVAAGTCTITISQPGDSRWAPAQAQTVSLQVNVAPVHNAPVVTAPHTLAQKAGSTTSASVTVTSPDMPVTLTVTSPVNGVTASVVRGATAGTFTVKVTAAASVSRRVDLRGVATTSAGKATAFTIADMVIPNPVAWAHRHLTSAGTVVSWAKSATTGATYRVTVGGTTITTRGTSITLGGLYGPKATFRVAVVGQDNTASTSVTATVVHGTAVIETIRFVVGGSSLTRTQRAQIERIIHEAKAAGYTTVTANGYTDRSGSWAENVKLSAERAAAVARVARAAGVHATAHGYGPTHLLRTAALSRRVEIVVSY